MTDEKYQAIRSILFNVKYPNGFRCECGHDEYTFYGKYDYVKCSRCHGMYALTKGTVLSHSRDFDRVLHTLVILDQDDEVTGATLSTHLAIPRVSAYRLLKRLRKYLKDGDEVLERLLELERESA